jgi:hypothetical protein
MILRLLRVLPLTVTVTATVWALSTNPLARPFVDRTANDLRIALERKVSRAATSDWIEGALADAVTTRDVDRARMLMDLSADLNRPVDTRSAEAMIDARSGWITMAADCAACMADVSTCPTLTQVAACAVPFEMSPLGDLNALRRAGVAWVGDRPVDELDAGLALVGLAATGAIVVSGGSSVTIKAGTGLLRLARRMGSVTPDLARMLRLPVRWSRVDEVMTGVARLEDAIDAPALARIQSLAGDLGRVATATSPAEALRLARFVDTPEDAAKLARVAEAAGPRTTRSFAVLGKTRVFRATVRLGRMAAGTLLLIWLTAAQIAVIIGTRLSGIVLRGLLRPVIVAPTRWTEPPAQGNAGSH